MPLIRQLENSIFNIFDQERLELLTRLRLGFSHLNEHRFRQNFQECLNRLCKCSVETENNCQYLLHCHLNTPFHIYLFWLILSPYQTVTKLKFSYMETKCDDIKMILYYELL